MIVEILISHHVSITHNGASIFVICRDVSFLYDVPIEKEKRQKPDQFDPTEVRKDEELEEQRPKKKVPSRKVT